MKLLININLDYNSLKSKYFLIVNTLSFLNNSKVYTPIKIRQLILILFLVNNCVSSNETIMEIKKKSFGHVSETEIILFTIKHDDGTIAKFTNYGATLVALKIPDKNKKIDNVVLGFDQFEQYKEIRAFYGATVGRYANRIDNGNFVLNGKEFQLNSNEGNNHLHGGINGFDRVIWDYEIIEDSIPSIKFSYLSEDGEENYPGNFNISVTYSFTPKHELIIQYEMSTDQPTIKNVSNHSYFNLSGNVKNSILNHYLQLNSEEFLPIDDELIPTGELRKVEDTPMDFRKPIKIGARINLDNTQLKYGGGYDHCWVLNQKTFKDDLIFAGELFDSVSGRVMEIYTTEPAIQFYSGNFMDGTHKGREGIPYKYRHAVCLETQHYPDSPNHENFPSTILNPGDKYISKTVYKFFIK